MNPQKKALPCQCGLKSCVLCLSDKVSILFADPDKKNWTTFKILPQKKCFVSQL